MKIVIFSILIALATAATLPGNATEAFILEDLREGPIEGNYRFLVETSDGFKQEESGSPGALGQVNIKGSYSYINPEGNTIVVNYIADENGFQPTSDILPVAPPAPPHVEALLRIAEEQRAAGIVFE